MDPIGIIFKISHLEKPYMTIAVDTLMNLILQEMIFYSALYDFRYPEISMDQIRQLNSDHILLSSEPFPFKQKETASKHSCHSVDGTYFS